ncbi:uncharacterized protein LOC126907769 [Daktulosphaira vitifoliae]|uniref:uncharacterized protein LOC126907769 n=1 Tax=Daktulosphaira vitifoliae TaxID=58002 RepID=UPI0021A97A25|nr:uncharacterized protein LOC126907769 [Daktulosphaira vitifoliae]
MQHGIIVFIYFTHLVHVLTLDPKNTKSNHLEYVIAVIDYIRVQEGWNSIKHLQLNHNENRNITIGNVFSQNVDRSNILNMFSIVVHLLNYKYTEILRSYVELVTLSIKECKIYSIAYLLSEYIDCTQRIEQKVKNSFIMFENLYQVMTFMSYFDTKWLFINISGIPFVMVEEIYFAYHYTNTMKISDKSFFIDQSGSFILDNATSVLSNIKNFIDQLYLMLENNESKNYILSEFPESINYQFCFEEQYLHYKSVNSNTRAIDVVLMMLDSLYNNTIKNDFECLGFKEIINPLLYKCYSLYVPLTSLYCISNELGILNMNILLNEGNWMTLKYLYIKHNDQLLSANRVLRDQANSINFHLKKQYFTQLFRCRFYDLLKTFNSHLCGTLDLCKKERTNIKKWKNSNRYIECLKHFYMITRSIQNFLKHLKMAMDKLKKANIWHDNGSHYCLSPIKNIVENILYWIQEINLLRYEFSHSESLNLNEIADDYLKRAQYVKISFLEVFHNVARVHKNHCFYIEKPTHLKNYLLETSNTNVDSTNYSIPTIISNTNYQQACVEFDRFCEYFIRVEYNNLGFDNPKLISKSKIIN